jgi:hypothetical protein
VFLIGDYKYVSIRRFRWIQQHRKHERFTVWLYCNTTRRSSRSGGANNTTGYLVSAELYNPSTGKCMKTYAGAQGYVYQYFFVGQRAALASDPEAPAREFVFNVTSDRKLTYAVSVCRR